MLDTTYSQSIWSNKNFLKLWGNQLLLQIAFNMSNYTALLILANHFHSPIVQAQFFVALTIPAFLFGLVAGPLIDVVNRKSLMLICDFLLGLFFLLYMFSSSNVWLLMGIAFATSSVARFFVPSQFATLPFVVKKEQLEKANALFLFTLLGAVLIGYAVAGPIIQFSGGLGTRGEVVPFFLSSCMLFVGYLLLLSFKNIQPPKVDVQAESFLKGVLQLFSQTVAAIKTDTYLSFSLVLLVFIELLIGFLSVVILEYVRQYLLLPLTAVSYIFIFPLMFGLLLGILVLAKVEKRFGYYKTIGASCGCIGILFVSLGGLPQLIDSYEFVRYFSIAVAFILGIVFVFITVQSRTILQHHTPKNMQGRIFSFLDILIALATPVPVLALGFLANTLNLLTTLVLFGVGIILATVLGSKLIHAEKL